MEVIKTQMDKWFDELLKATGEDGDAGRAYELVCQRYGILLYETAAERQTAHIATMESYAERQVLALEKIASMM